ncbi:MAG: hypothetical protein ACKVU4_15765 [Phycisphaerales bacterium]
MSRFKTWHGVLFVAAAGAIAWFVYDSMSKGPEVTFASSVVMVDVTTGELFSFDVSGRRAVVIPEKNPATGKAALLGVEKAADGRWFIRERHRPLLRNVPGPHAAVADPATGEVRVKSETIQRGRS